MLKMLELNSKNAEDFSTKALAIEVVVFANWWSALAYAKTSMIKVPKVLKSMQTLRSQLWLSEKKEKRELEWPNSQKEEK